MSWWTFRGSDRWATSRFMRQIVILIILTPVNSIAALAFPVVTVMS